MPISSDTYQAILKSCQAWAYLSEAREIKSRIDRGDAVYQGEASRIPTLVRLARMFMQLSVAYRRLNRP